MRELLREGLSRKQKSLPAAFLYDELGSVLFEAITLLPEYEVARVDFRLLERHTAEVLDLLPGRVQLVELGPGHGRKARVVLEQLTRRQPTTSFVGVDVSQTALSGCRRNLEDLKSVEVTSIEGTFIDGLVRAPRAKDCRRLVTFLGSNLSNFDRDETAAFFRQVRESLVPGDAMLLSADLEKPFERLRPAYDDALGVTACFIRNALTRLNREYGANFSLTNFQHDVRWSAEALRVEMHLRALTACEVAIPGLGLELRFAAHETIWTESSHRFRVDELAEWGKAAGFRAARSWVDEAWPLALTLFIAQ